MKNETLIKEIKQKLKEILSDCTNSQQLKFKKMYYPSNLEASVDETIEQMDSDKLDWAYSQCERTIELNQKRVIGEEVGKKCNRYLEDKNEYCEGTIYEKYVEGGCSCFSNPPCDYCTTPKERCDECEWDAEEEYNAYWREQFSKPQPPSEHYKVRTVSDLDSTKIDYISQPNNGHYSTKFIGVYPEGTTAEDILKLIRGAFGGRFDRFGHGHFVYIAYND